MHAELKLIAHMSNEHISYYSLSIHPSVINVYYQSSGSTGRRLEFDRVPDNLKLNAHKGKVSAIAKRKITRAIDYLIYLSRPKKLPPTIHGKNYTFTLNFITLTLSSKQVHSDQEIKAVLLNQFFIEMARKWKVGAYIWRAEKQENGNIHFHIITGKFIPWLELRNTWNRIQQKLGYVTRYRENREIWHEHGFRFQKTLADKWSYAKQLQAYKKGTLTHWDSPNSTDVHSLKHIGNIKAYFIKYMTKNEQIHNLTGRLWGCSINLSNLEGAGTDMDSLIKEELDKLVKSGKANVYHSEYFSCFYIPPNLLEQLECIHLLTVFRDYMCKKFPMFLTPELF